MEEKAIRSRDSILAFLGSRLLRIFSFADAGHCAAHLDHSENDTYYTSAMEKDDLNDCLEDKKEWDKSYSSNDYYHEIFVEQLKDLLPKVILSYKNAIEYKSITADKWIDLTNWWIIKTSKEITGETDG